ncbi:addiction module protein [Rhodohalobacter sulfatireducens]|uniref:Addiction module protein n=1 Tax=Rhodohalobacter sulfatireducens TaxID=2911366 RepID=A0ABS9K9L3_9BACT|nr:addiction module protein [Rhodohalobacter sulfatireducens]MCG2587545.1 addiction module protein [Rhodohalobacter sulfatireducens]MDR9366182.1 addiction module protein [Balneolaceae bacterium]MDR9409164.1 addiction module protein [Balneolaceae bacterium]
MIKPSEVKNLSVEEKLLLMEALWNDLSEKVGSMEIPESHKAILDEREKKIQVGEAKFVDWEKAKKQINKAVQ